MKRLFLFLCIAVVYATHVYSQFPYGTTGLLHMPTAAMQRDKTFMAGASFLNNHATPAAWKYDTYNYYINITFFPWLEVGYTCTLNKGVPGKYWPKRTWGKFVNQDRQFSARIRLIKENYWGKYTPAVVIGGNDFTTNDKTKDKGYGIGKVTAEGNGDWNRYYIAVSKHLSFPQAGYLGIHLAYVYNRRKGYPLNGPCLGADFRPAFHRPLQVMAEYDSKTVNLGLGYSIWKDHINLIGELNDFKYLSAGIYFKIHLK